jgi:hypothetical protein
MQTKCAPLLRLLLLSACLGFFIPFIAQQSYPPLEAITYHNLDGNDSTLRAFSARHVRYALPDSWIGPSGARGLSPTEKDGMNIRQLRQRGGLKGNNRFS